MMALFDGLGRAYGTYRITGVENGKQVGEAVTVTGDVTEKLWEEHLKGGKGIGVVPIKDDSSCRFGALDIDKYDGLDVAKTIETARKKKFPLVPCSSKSGGLHLFLFGKDPVSAAVMRAKLGLMAEALGFDGCEVFPKQSQVLAERGDIGSWINMPYFDAEKTARFGYGDDGKKLDFEDFLAFAEKHLADIENIKVERPESKGDFTDGPVCLQSLIEDGVPEGMRNDVLFNVGVYLRKALPKRWVQELEKVNAARFKPPLDSSEVQALIKGAGRTGCFYGCKKPFLKSRCDKGICRTRKYGIGNDEYFPILAGLTKYDTTPPIWFLDVEAGGRIELTTDDLQNQLRFQRRCMDVLNKITPMIKPDQWQSLLRSLMDKVSVIDVPKEASASGQLVNHLETFCTARAQAKVREEILLGKPWLDGGWHHFRMGDFLLHLERIRFHDFKVHKITQLVRGIGGRHEFMKLRGKGVNVWKVPEFERQRDDAAKEQKSMGDVL